MKYLFLYGSRGRGTSSKFPFFNLSFLCIKKYIFFKFMKWKFIIDVVSFKGEVYERSIFLYIVSQNDMATFRAQKSMRLHFYSGSFQWTYWTTFTKKNICIWWTVKGWFKKALFSQESSKETIFSQRYRSLYSIMKIIEDTMYKLVKLQGHQPDHLTINLNIKMRLLFLHVGCFAPMHILSLFSLIKSPTNRPHLPTWATLFSPAAALAAEIHKFRGLFAESRGAFLHWNKNMDKLSIELR